MSAIMTDEDYAAMAETRALEPRGRSQLESAMGRDRRRMDALDKDARRLLVRAKGLVEPEVLPWLLRRAADLAERASRSPKHRPHPVRNAKTVGS